MALESASYPNQLVAANPSGSDRVHQGDDHIRLIKAVLKATFPNIAGPINLTHGQINDVYKSAVPFGAVMLWYGAANAVPAGWAICSGQEVDKTDGTGKVTLPDLRGRVAIGVSSEYVQGTPYGQSGHTLSTSGAGGHSHTGGTHSSGAHNHGGGVSVTALTVDQMPAHQHGNGIADNDDGSGIFWRGTKPSTQTGRGIETNNSGGREGVTESIGAGQAHGHGIGSDGGHSHGVWIDGVGEHSHAIGTFSVVQPSLALHYIMKI